MTAPILAAMLVFIMVTLTVALTVDQIVDLVDRLPSEERRRLLDILLAQRLGRVLEESDNGRQDKSALSDAELQSEIDAVREKRRLDRRRAPGR